MARKSNGLTPRDGSALQYAQHAIIPGPCPGDCYDSVYK